MGEQRTQLLFVDSGYYTSSPSDKSDSGELLFVTDIRSKTKGGPSQQDINRHVQRFKTKKKTKNAKSPPKVPEAVMIKYKVASKNDSQRPSPENPEAATQIVESISKTPGGFDPFDSLATRRPGQTLDILRRHFFPFRPNSRGPRSPHNIDMMCGSLWDMAMMDTAWYHTMAASTYYAFRKTRHGISNYLGHRSLALSAMQQTIQNVDGSTETSTALTRSTATVPTAGVAMIMSVAYHLSFAVDDRDLEAANIHARALKELAALTPIDSMPYNLWGIILAMSAEHAMWAACPPAVHPAIHPEYDLTKVLISHAQLDELARDEAHVIMAKIPSFEDRKQGAITLFNLYRRVFLRSHLQQSQSDDRGVVVLNGSIRHALCLHVAQTKSLLKEGTDADSREILQAIYCILLTTLLFNTASAIGWPTRAVFTDTIFPDRMRTLEDLKTTIREFDVGKWRKHASVESLIWVWYLICNWLVQGKYPVEAEGLRLKEALNAQNVRTVEELQKLLESFPKMPDGPGGEISRKVWEKIGMGQTGAVELEVQWKS